MRLLVKRWDMVFTLLLFLAVIPAEYHEIFSLVEEQTLSFRQLLRQTHGDPEHVRPVQDIVLINTDELFYEEYGSFPLRRQDLATLVDNLKLLGAKVIALDILMDFPSSYGEDPVLSTSLEKAGNTLLVSQAHILDGKVEGINYPTEALRTVTRSGYTNIASASSVVTSLSRLKIYRDAIELADGWPFAVQALAMYWGVEPRLEGNLLKIGDHISLPLDQFDSFYIDFPALPTGVRFLSESNGITALEFLDISDFDEDELDELRYWVEDKLVLVGDTSEVSHDWFDTPVDMVYGVEIIADTIATLMKGGVLRSAPLSLEISITLIIMLVMILSALQSSPLLRVVIQATTMAVHVAILTVVHVKQGLVISMSYVLFASLLALLAINLRYYMQERGQKKMIKGAFGQYLSPKVVDILVKDPSRLRLGGEQREMTAFFSDVAAFSTISESLKPTELVELLNEYLTAMCDIIATYDGTVDKFEGDAIIGFWGAPLRQDDHAKLACYTSIDMNVHMIQMRQALEQQGRPEMNIRIGLNSGPMVVGNMGSAQRMDYTIMGDSVNLAARLEGANKFYNSGTMLSEYTHAQCAEFIDARELDTVRVVGKNTPITIYQLLDRKNQTSGPLAEVVELFARGREAYNAMDFVTAQEIFSKALKILPDDGPSRTYLDRCRLYAEVPPPADWDRVFNFTSKG
ncbi:MAG: adenylate/guanylate cyclase domain-containing protein [Magnetococcales bacterium]|nr:adenylate/guanylate cyclase domain-containing protein [Magnetococcales bacterium]